MLIVTTEEIAGRVIEEVLGEVMGVSVRTLNPFSEGIKRVDGRPATEIVVSMMRWRKEALAHLAEEAEYVGADAVTGMKFDNRILSSTWTEICAYGTAVRLAPVDVPLDAPHVGRARPIAAYQTAPQYGGEYLSGS
ncbi:MAG TPA: heavy metal-binding domain-containing protein [Micromonosporaceae bacterium]|nr:heavy metal-binding domain-containing protein [Micromonosporaceae bacterium]